MTKLHWFICRWFWCFKKNKGEAFALNIFSSIKLYRLFTETRRCPVRFFVDEKSSVELGCSEFVLLTAKKWDEITQRPFNKG